jgi:hypothetical protein
MTKPQLRVLAIVLSGLILVVLFAGLDDLPRRQRAEIASEQQSLATAGKQLQKAREEVAADLRAEPDLFRVRAMDSTLPARLTRAESSLRTAEQDMRTLAGFAKANRRADRDKVERLLREEKSLRANAVDEASAVASEARRWLDLKNHLPEQVAQMQRDYQAVRAADLLKVTAVVQKAENDWPEKKSDLESKLVAVTTLPAQAEAQWQGSSEMRRKVASNDLAGLDYSALIGSADALHQESQALPQKTKELEDQSGQLYDAWDKILVDLDVARGGDQRYYKEKLRTVRTHFADVAAKKSETSTDERWVEVSPAQYHAVEHDLGMAIEHKSAGKYDSEAERVAQPAGFAYVAPPAQGSNQYGYWDHRGSQSFWVWFPQYLILRDLLYNRYYPPLTAGEYYDYHSTWSRGRTYYGYEQSGGTSVPKYGTSGTHTQQRYGDSTYSRSGGYKDSRYANQGGGYKGSRYESGSSRSGESAEPRTFGRQGDSSRPGSPSGPRGWSGHSPGGSRPSPRSAPSGGRSFGGGRRR